LTLSDIPRTSTTKISYSRSGNSETRMEIRLS
jgi:hypothetical protein